MSASAGPEPMEQRISIRWTLGASHPKIGNLEFLRDLWTSFQSFEGASDEMVFLISLGAATLSFENGRTLKATKSELKVRIGGLLFPFCGQIGFYNGSKIALISTENILARVMIDRENDLYTRLIARQEEERLWPPGEAFAAFFQTEANSLLIAPAAQVKKEIREARRFYADISMDEIPDKPDNGEYSTSDFVQLLGIGERGVRKALDRWVQRKPKYKDLVYDSNSKRWRFEEKWLAKAFIDFHRNTTK